MNSSTIDRPLLLPMGLNVGDNVTITTDIFEGADIHPGDVGVAIEWDGTYLSVAMPSGSDFPFRVDEFEVAVSDEGARGAYVGDDAALQELPEGTVLRALDNEGRVFSLYRGEWYTAGYAAAMNRTLGVFASNFGCIVLDAPGFATKAA